MATIKKRFMGFALLAASILLAAFLFGCANNASEEVEKPSGQAQVEEPAVDPMADRKFVDDTGRTLTIPGVGALKKVYYTSPIAQIFCFTLAPELAAGTNMRFTPEELKFLPEGTEKLEFLGTLAGGQELNPEAIMAAGTQLIISMGPAGVTAGDADKADSLQNKTKIPVIVLDGSFEQTTHAYEQLGKIFGKEDLAQKLAEYCEKTLSDIDAAVAKIPEDKRISLYYAEGPEGLQSEPAGTPHAMVFERAGAKNVVVGIEAKKGTGLTPISLEQILDWNPDVIVTWKDSRKGGGAYSVVTTDPNWSSLKAVQNGKVYAMPQSPYSWLDRPPSVNRIIGIQWICNLLYPDYYKIDIVKNTQEFYSLFYHRDITPEQVHEIIGM